MLLPYSGSLLLHFSFIWIPYCWSCSFELQTKEPKAVLRISELNVAFAPKKIGNPNSLQITFLKDGSTRHIYVYHDDPETIVNWYMAIRSAKFNRLHVAYPSANESEVKQCK